MSLRVALCYPNSAAVAHANLGFEILRQRVAGWPDVEIEEHFAGARKRSARPLSHCDVVLLSISFEGDLLGLVQLLLDGGVEPLASRRGRGPLIIVGGMVPTLNPEPLAEIVDLACIGDAEGLLPDLERELVPLLRAGAPRDGLLETAAAIEGVYVPAYVEPQFGDDGRLRSLHSRLPNTRVQRRVVSRLDQDAAAIPVVTGDEIFAGCAVLEASRGCPWGCRFCAAGFVQRPYRERAQDTLLHAVDGALGPHRRIGLVGADIGDLSSLHSVVDHVHQAGATVTPSALRASAIDERLAQALTLSGKRTATFAPEAGSERLRAVINKHLSQEQLLHATDLLAAAGVQRLRLYFMLGLPTECDDDVDAIATLTLELRQRLMLHGRQLGRVGGVTVSVNPFVPKPATPFQREPFCDLGLLRQRSRRLRKRLAGEDNVELKVEPLRHARTQAILARGDRRIGPLLIQAARGNHPLSELLDQHPEIAGPALAGFDDDDVLPWALVDHRIGEKFLRRERDRSRAGKLTPPCAFETCSACELGCSKA